MRFILIFAFASTMAIAQAAPTPVVSDPTTLAPNSPASVHQKDIDRIKTITRAATSARMKADAAKNQADVESAAATKLISDTQKSLGLDPAYWEWSPKQEDFVHKAGVK